MTTDIIHLVRSSRLSDCGTTRARWHLDLTEFVAFIVFETETEYISCAECKNGITPKEWQEETKPRVVQHFWRPGEEVAPCGDTSSQRLTMSCFITTGEGYLNCTGSWWPRPKCQQCKDSITPMEWLQYVEL